MLLKETIDRRLLPKKIGKWLLNDSSKGSARYSWPIKGETSVFSLCFADLPNELSVSFCLETQSGLYDMILSVATAYVLSTDDKTDYVVDFVTDFNDESQGFRDLVALTETMVKEPVSGILAAALNKPRLRLSKPADAFKKAISDIDKDMNAVAIRMH